MSNYEISESNKYEGNWRWLIVPRTDKGSMKAPVYANGGTRDEAIHNGHMNSDRLRGSERFMVIDLFNSKVHEVTYIKERRDPAHSDRRSG